MQQTDTPENRFWFGRNWRRFVEHDFSQERVDVSRGHMTGFLGVEDLKGRSFMDIGCGSGLHSLAAHQLGAATITAFDYDPDSVAASRILHRYAGAPTTWTISRGSVLDEAFMQSLPKADVVYSWGVLHHTGDVWRALRLAATRVKAGGSFYIALYSADVHKDPPPEFWLDVKQRYVAAPAWRRRCWDLWYVWRFQMARNPLRFPVVLWRILRHKRTRGMSYFTDIRDWLGGWPMEFCRDDDVRRLCEGELGLRLVKMKTGEANTEFLFERV
jgi:2-polyprenyl-6-hydroxyphenyl methylase/3-demethylubiquinone-9 3-methyltransferase